MPPRLQKICSCKCFRRAADAAAASRDFSSTPLLSRRQTRQRQKMFEWLEGPGKVFRNALPGSTNYLNAYDFYGNLLRVQQESAGARKTTTENDSSTGATMTPRDTDAEESEIDGGGALQQQAGGRADLNLAGPKPIPHETKEDFVVFPANPNFRSQPVLSEELKDKIYDTIIQGKMTVREVAVYYGVDMRRIGAVVRLKGVEKKWIEEGKPLATAYSQGILAMLPQTHSGNRKGHEAINELTVHKATKEQIFWPTSESRHFTRADAGEVFQPGLLPAEKRIPHPELYKMAATDSSSLPLNAVERRETLQATMRSRDAAQAKRQGQRLLSKAAATTLVTGPRCNFKFEDVKVERTGTRFAKGVGARYGLPAQDRKKGMVKIPTAVGASEDEGRYVSGLHRLPA